MSATPFILGTSLKMYFSHQQTVSWVTSVAQLIADHTTRDQLRAFVLPQYPSIPACLSTGGMLAVGAQDVAAEDDGAFTGEVSGRVLAELGCRYVTVGHAERRRLFGETSAVVRAKTHAAFRNGLIPVLCVGEVSHSRPEKAAAACVQQVDEALQGVSLPQKAAEVIIAYEPLWAIGADKPAGPEEINAVCSLMREHVSRDDLQISIIYGGSAGPGLLSTIHESVDGMFLGRFAHDPAAVRDILDEMGSLAA